MNQKITFKELAIKSGVSIGTLSRYFNNGSISLKNKIRIKTNIDKYGFVRNNAATRLRGKNEQMIILRTVIRSETIDNIISGIIEHIKSDVIVKYSGQKEKDVIKGINNAISEAPKYLVIFTPTDVSKMFEKTVLKASNYTKIILYNYEISGISSVNISYKVAFDNLAKSYHNINFIYNNKDDIGSFINRVKTLKESHIEVEISKVINQHKLNFYQSKLLYTQLAHQVKSKSILISYTQPIKFFNDVSWIFVDQYYIGVNIANLCLKNENKNIVIDALLKNL